MSTESGGSALLRVGPATGPGPGHAAILHLSTAGRIVLGYSRRWRSVTLSLVDVSFVFLLRLAALPCHWQKYLVQELQPKIKCNTRPEQT